MLALIVPWCVFILFAVAIIFFLRKKWMLCLGVSFVALFLNNRFECLPVKISYQSQHGSEKIIKVLSFNINGSSDGLETRVPKIVDLISKQEPDVLFLAEYPDDNGEVLDTLLRKYFVYSTCGGRCAHYFYSKYPISEQIRLNDGNENIGVYKCLINLNGDSISLYGCHFASNNYTTDKKYIPLDSVRNEDDLKTYFRDIQLSYKQRAHESSFIVEDMKGVKSPVIVMGDFNDVGGSTTIRVLEHYGLKDAWWVGGCGYGATIYRPLPYRIDHIMYCTCLELNSIKIISSDGTSDHDALFAEFEIKNILNK